MGGEEVEGAERVMSREDAGGRGRGRRRQPEEHRVSLSPGASRERGKKTKRGPRPSNRAEFSGAREKSIAARSGSRPRAIAICEKRASGDATAWRPASGVARGGGAGRTPTAVQRCKYLAANFPELSSSARSREGWGGGQGESGGVRANARGGWENRRRANVARRVRWNRSTARRRKGRGGAHLRRAPSPSTRRSWAWDPSRT